MPQAVSLTTKILGEWKQQVTSLELVPSGGGCFELSVDGVLLYSKLSTGVFPDEDQLMQRILQSKG